MGYKSIGRQLQLAREEAGFSQEQLAAKIGCSQSTLSNYEKGKRRIYLAQLEKIAEILNKPIEYFLRPVDYYREEQKIHSRESVIPPSPVQVDMGTSDQVKMSSSSMEEMNWQEKTQREQHLLTLFRSLSPTGQTLVINFVNWLKEREVRADGELQLELRSGEFD